MTIKYLCKSDDFQINLIVNRTQIHRDAAAELSTLKACPTEVYEALALLATDVKGFNNPSTWTNTQVTITLTL